MLSTIKKTNKLCALKTLISLLCVCLSMLPTLALATYKTQEEIYLTEQLYKTKTEIRELHEKTRKENQEWKKILLAQQPPSAFGTYSPPTPPPENNYSNSPLPNVASPQPSNGQQTEFTSPPSEVSYPSSPSPNNVVPPQSPDEQQTEFTSPSEGSYLDSSSPNVAPPQPSSEQPTESTSPSEESYPDSPPTNVAPPQPPSEGAGLVPLPPEIPTPELPSGPTEPTPPYSQGETQTDWSQVVSTVSTILRDALDQFPNNSFFYRIRGVILGPAGYPSSYYQDSLDSSNNNVAPPSPSTEESFIRTKDGAITRIDFSRTHVDHQGNPRPLLTENYFFHIFDSVTNTLKEVVKAINIYHVLNSDKIPASAPATDEEGRKILKEPSLQFIFKTSDATYYKEDGTGLDKLPSGDSVINATVVDTFNVGTIIVKILQAYKIVKEIIDKYGDKEVNKVPNDLETDLYRLTSTKNDNGDEEVIIREKGKVVLRTLDTIFEGREPFIRLRKISYISQNEHSEPKPQYETIIFELPTYNDSNPIDYYTVTNELEDLYNQFSSSAVYKLTLSDGFFKYANTPIPYNEPYSQIGLAAHIGSTRAEFSKPSASIIYYQTKLALLLKERLNFLNEQTNSLSESSASGNAGASHDAKLYLLTKKRDSALRSFNKLKEDVDIYIKNETERIGKIENPLTRTVELLGLEKIKSVFALSQSGQESISNTIQTLKNERDSLIEIAGKVEEARKNIDDVILKINAATSKLAQEVRRLEPQPQEQEQQRLQRNRLLQESPIDELYYDADRFIEQLQFHINRLRSAATPNLYYTYVVGKLISELEKRQNTLNSIKDRVVALGIPLIYELLQKETSGDWGNLGDDEAHELTRKAVYNFGSINIRKILARTDLLSKLASFSGGVNSTNYLNLVYGDSFGNGVIDIKSLFNELANVSSNYVMERKHQFLLGAIEEILLQKKIAISLEVSKKQKEIQTIQNQYETRFQTLTSTAQDAYSRWKDISQWFTWGNSLGTVIAANQQGVLEQIAAADNKIASLETEINNLTGQLIKLDLAEFAFESMLQKYFGRNDLSDYILIGAWLKYKSSLSDLDSTTFNLVSSALVRQVPNIGNTSSNANTFVSYLYNNNIKAAIEVEIPDINNPPDNIHNTPGASFFREVDKKFAEIRTLRPTAPLPISIYENIEYSCGRTSYRPALFAFRYSKEFQKFFDEFIKLQKSLNKFYIFASFSASNNKIYRSIALSNTAAAARNDLANQLERAQNAAQPILTWLGATYKNYIGELSEVITPGMAAVPPWTDNSSATGEPVYHEGTPATPPVTRDIIPGIFPQDFFAGTIERTGFNPNAYIENALNQWGRVYQIIRGGQIFRITHSDVAAARGRPTSIPYVTTYTQICWGGNNQCDTNDSPGYVGVCCKKFTRNLPNIVQQQTAKLIYSLWILNPKENGDLFNQIRNINFRDSTWASYFKGEFLIQSIAIITGVILAFISGGSSILAMSAYGALGGIVGAQIASEVLYLMHVGRGGDPSLAPNQGSFFGQWLRNITNIPTSFWAAIDSFAQNVVSPLVTSFVVSFATTFATLGFGQQIVNFISTKVPIAKRIFSNITKDANKAKNLETNFQTLRFVSNTSHSSSFTNLFKEIFQELREELLYENFIASGFSGAGDHIAGLAVVVAGGLRQRRSAAVQAQQNIYVFDPKAKTTLTQILEKIGYKIENQPNGDFIATRPMQTVVNNQIQNGTQSLSFDGVEARDPNTDDPLPSSEGLEPELSGSTEREMKKFVPLGIYRLSDAFHNLSISIVEEMRLARWELEEIIATLENVPKHIRDLAYPVSTIEIHRVPSLISFPKGAFDGRLFAIRLYSSSSNLVESGTVLHEIGHLLHALININNGGKIDWKEISDDKTLKQLYEKAIAATSDADSEKYEFSLSETIADLFMLYAQTKIIGRTIDDWADMVSLHRLGGSSFVISLELLANLQPVYNYLVNRYFDNVSFMQEAAAKHSELVKLKKSLINMMDHQYKGNYYAAASRMYNIINNLTEDPLMRQQLRLFGERLVGGPIAQILSNPDQNVLPANPNTRLTEYITHVRTAVINLSSSEDIIKIDSPDHKFTGAYFGLLKSEYDKVRKPQTPYPEIKGILELASIKNPDVFDFNITGWFRRYSRATLDRRNTEERYSLNVNLSPDLIRELDQFIVKYGGGYKFAANSDNRYDSVNMYPSWPLSQEAQIELARIANKYLRGNGEGLIGEVIRDENEQEIRGIRKEYSSTHPETLAFINFCSQIDPALGEAVKLYFYKETHGRPTPEIGPSTGQVTAVRNVIENVLINVGVQSLSQITTAINRLQVGQSAIIGREGDIKASDMPQSISRKHVRISKIGSSTYNITNFSSGRSVYLYNSQGVLDHRLLPGGVLQITSGTIISLSGEYPILIP